VSRTAPIPEQVDVAVIGGGPAGSTAATLLRKSDPERRIVVFEQAEFPRHHVGESTLPDMNPILAKLGVLEKIDGAGFVRKTGITYRWHVDRPAFSEVFSEGVLDALAVGGGHLPDHSWQVDRSRYDAILLDHARESGVSVHTRVRVEDVVREGERVVGLRVRPEGGAAVVVRAGHVVDGSGQARVLSRWLGLEKQAHALGDLAVYRYYGGITWNPDLVGTYARSKIFFSATPAGWMWFIPLSATVASVGLVTRAESMHGCTPDALFDRELATIPEMTAMLGKAVRSAAPGAPATDALRTWTVSDWSYSHTRPSGPGYYVAGDAAAFVDPILSSGILLAHHSGLSVANAIRTEWHVPDIRPGELWDGYARFYADLYRGFLVMAEWWYGRRRVAGIDEWLRMAVELGRTARGASAVDTDDARSFMTFAAGYLADFRFVNLGIAFGDQGLSKTFGGITGSVAAGDRLRRELPDRGARYRRAFDRVEVEPYVATDVDSDRWWRLPAVRFLGDFGERLYRPPVPREERGERPITLVLRIVERVLAACDGTRSVDHVVRDACRSFQGAEEPRVRSLANLVLSDMVLLDLVRAV
jgi:flavin-dependent dehydrogenase